MTFRSSKLRRLVLMTPALWLPSCATIISGTYQSVSIESTPSGAQVEVDLMPRGTTPVEVPLRRGKPHQVTFYKDGFKAERVVTVGRFNPLTLFTIWFPPAALLDGMNRSMISIGPNPIHVSLHERMDGDPPTSPVDSPAPLARYEGELD